MAEASPDRRSVLRWALAIPASLALVARRGFAAAPAACVPTQDDIQGPMYVPGAQPRVATRSAKACWLPLLWAQVLPKSPVPLRAGKGLLREVVVLPNAQNAPTVNPSDEDAVSYRNREKEDSHAGELLLVFHS
jgi:hypothetical protein